jgi:hypothetical protein
MSAGHAASEAPELEFNDRKSGASGTPSLGTFLDVCPVNVRFALATRAGRFVDFSETAAITTLVVPGEGFEPPTFGLQNRCTTTVLTRQRHVISMFWVASVAVNTAVCHPFATLHVRQRPAKRRVDTLGGVFLQARDGVAVRVHRDGD